MLTKSQISLINMYLHRHATLKEDGKWYLSEEGTANKLVRIGKTVKSIRCWIYLLHYKDLPTGYLKSHLSDDTFIDPDMLYVPKELEQEMGIFI